ncbi:glycoside hydrolase family 2 [Flammeovirga sp. MY04]|uniref:sugar-binding domain-containing protein n=1 Tax=Flammeovirga sp. MY04 TaxID=1191459 RepID=UPI0008063CFB|nr:sugar-binding domain-containing protein [Flammeovirga sp. MY04]ANQ51663.1 glycoside hydrolase family 2 [Flammeovirga sp. MY04]
MRPINYLIIALLSLQLFSCNGNKQYTQETLSLAGDWKVALDYDKVGKDQKWFLSDLKNTKDINLPSTLDDAGIGEKTKLGNEVNQDNLYQLSRERSYIGPAWYQKEIEVPSSWKGKSISILMERVIWTSEVYVDGKLKGSHNSLIGQHKIDLGKLTPGKHQITICIDNSRLHHLFSDEKEIQDFAHAYTNTTQIIWNGILGDFKLIPVGDYELKNITVLPNVKDKNIDFKVSSNGISQKQLEYIISDSQEQTITRGKLTGVNKEIVSVKGDFKTWDEFDPKVYTLQVVEGNELLYTTNFGIREISTQKNNLMLNGHRIFLRGTLECAIFPLTGHPPMDKEGWAKVFDSAKAYGLNHLRFHSWCPPEDAFNVADSMGFYIQVELPNWSLEYGKFPEMVKWERQEAFKMLEEYGNHPSFCFMSMGNELEGNFDALTTLVQDLKNTDQRRLFTTSSFSFEQPHGTVPEKVDDFWISQWTKKGWIRGQGVFDTYSPTFDKNYQANMDFIEVPVIQHEIGQYSVYPNLEEIKKYTGNLIPNNFNIVKNDLEKKGRLNLAQKYLEASGQLAKILYKEEIERAIKTPAITGFQLLDLHDFPGQGTALVGLLDAFWDSKGIITGPEFRQFCSELVPLLSFPKAVYTNAENFKGKVEVANYWKEVKNPVFEWEAKKKASGEILKNGAVTKDQIGQGTFNTLGDIEFSLSEIKEPTELQIEVALKGTDYRNHWSIWVYPAKQQDPKSDVIVTSDWGKAQKELAKGGKVLFTPAIKSINGIEGKFVSVFWSPVHFPDQPGTMGLLMDPKHEAFNHFPTDFHTNWQWWDLCKKSKSLDLGDSKITPIVTVVDNFYKNRHMGNVIEMKVGKGKLLFSSIDLHSDLEKRPVAQALRTSLMDYMNDNSKFNPTYEMSYNEFKKSFKAK